MKAQLLSLSIGVIVCMAGCSSDAPDGPKREHNDQSAADVEEGKREPHKLIEARNGQGAGTIPSGERIYNLSNVGTFETRFDARFVFHETRQAALTLPPGSFQEQLIQFAAEYQTYGLADRAFGWAEIDCRAVPSGRLRTSQSNNTETHGSKLYLIFARRIWESITHVSWQHVLTLPEGICTDRSSYRKGVVASRRSARW